jgi:hypothetical protein
LLPRNDVKSDIFFSNMRQLYMLQWQSALSIKEIQRK